MKNKPNTAQQSIAKNYKSKLQVPSDGTSKLQKAANKVNELLSKVDLFGKPIILRYNGNDVFKSAFGGILSLSIIALIGLYLAFALILFLGRSSPIYSSINERKSIPDDLELSSIETPIDWTVGIDVFDNNLNGSVFDPTIFSIDMQRVSLTAGVKNKESSYYSIEVDCKESPAFSSVFDHVTRSPNGSKKTTKTSYYDLFKMANDKGNETAYCFKLDNMLDWNTNKKVPTVLSGSSTTENEEYMSLTIKICNNDTIPDGNPPCKSLHEIRDKLNFYQVRYYFTHHAFVANDSLQDPVVNSTAYFQFPMQQYFSKTYNLFVQKNKVQDTWNLLSTKPTTKTTFTYSSENLEIDFINDGIDPKKHLLQINIKVDAAGTTFIRKFQNILEFFVSIVGILNGIFLAGKAAGMFLNGLLLRVDLINRSFFVINDDKTSDSHSDSASASASASASESNQKNGEKKINFNAEMSNLSESPSKDVLNMQEKSNRTLISKEKDVSFQPIVNLEDQKSLMKMFKMGMKENVSKKVEDVDENKGESNNNQNNNNNIQTPPGLFLNPYYNDESLLLPAKAKRFDKFKMSIIEVICQMLPCCTKFNKPLLVKKKIFQDCGSIIESYFDIERIIALLREFQDLKNVVLSPEEYSILRQLTFPKIEVNDDEISIRKVEKNNVDEKQLKNSYSQFVQNVNRMIKTPYLNNIETNLLEIYRHTYTKQ